VAGVIDVIDAIDVIALSLSLSDVIDCD